MANNYIKFGLTAKDVEQILTREAKSRKTKSPLSNPVAIYRAVNGITQLEMSRIFGVSLACIKAYENLRRDIPVRIINFIEALNRVKVLEKRMSGISDTKDS